MSIDDVLDLRPRHKKLTTIELTDLNDALRELKSDNDNKKVAERPNRTTIKSHSVSLADFQRERSASSQNLRKLRQFGREKNLVEASGIKRNAINIRLKDEAQRLKVVESLIAEIKQQQKNSRVNHG